MKIQLNAPRHVIEGALNGILDSWVDSHSVSGAPLPLLYRSGIRYKHDPGEHWQLPEETSRLGYGDCEDLAMYRAGELRLAGENARVIVTESRPRMLHAQVLRGNGSIEDPSRALGMNNGSIGEDPMPPVDPLDMLPLDPGTRLLLNLARTPQGKRMFKKLKKKFW